MSEDINILHLSDLHFGKESELETTALDNRTNVLTNLIDEITSLEEAWRPNIVVVSGDIGNKGLSEDYAQAKRWLSKLLSSLSLTPNDLVLSPGNHDRNMPSAASLMVPKQEEWEEADNLLKIEALTPLLAPFSNFEKFCEDFGVPKFTFPGSDNYLFGQRQVKSISFIVLNSSWFYVPKKNERGLWLGLQHLIHLKAKNILINPKNFDTETLTIGVFHHPPREYLSEFEIHSFGNRAATLDLFSKHAHVFLNGHVHAIPTTNDKIAGRTLQIIAGTSYSGANYPNSFNILKITPSKRTLVQKVFSYDSGEYEWREGKTLPTTSLKSISALTGDEKKNELEFVLKSISEQITDYFPKRALKKLTEIESEIKVAENKELLFRFENLRAFALQEMSNFSEAAICYLKSYEINPEVELAKANKAFAHFLMGEVDTCNTFLSANLPLFPENSLFNCLRILLSSKEQDMNFLKANIPSVLWGQHDIQYSLAMKAEKESNLNDAITFLETAIKTEGFRKPFYKAALGNILLKKEIGQLQLLDPKDMPQKSRASLVKAEELLNDAWAKFRPTDQCFFQLPVLLSLAVVSNYLGKKEVALSLLDEGLSIDPQSMEFLTQKGRILSEDKNEKGIELLKEALAISSGGDIALILAAAQMNKGAFSECVDHLKSFISLTSDLKKNAEAERLLLICYCELKNFGEARKLSDKRIEKLPSSCEYLLERAKLERLSGNNEKAKCFVEKALSNLNQQNTEDIFYISNELYSLELYDKALSILEKVVEISDSNFTRLFVKLLYKLGKDNEILTVCKKIKHDFGLIKFFVDFEFYCYEKAQDIQAAKEILTQYLKDNPKDRDFPIRLAIINCKLEDFPAVDQFLDEDHDLNSLPWHELLNLASLNLARGREQNALNILYEARRKFPSQKEIHLAYVGAFLRRNENTSKLLDVTEIGFDCFVELKNQFGEAFSVTLENRSVEQIRNDEINSDHPWFSKIAGKKRGDVIVESGIQEKKWEIIEVKHKFVYAFQRSLLEYNFKFPGDPALQAINIEAPDSEKAKNKFDFTPIFNHLSDEKKRIEEIVESFKKRQIPICAFANLIGKDYHKVWNALTLGLSDLNIVSFSDGPERYKTSKTSLQEASGLVITPFSVLSSFLVKISNLIPRFKKLYVTQSTIDFFKNSLEYKKTIEKDGYHVLSSHEDKYIAEVISKEVVAEEISLFESILAWLKENATVATLYDRVADPNGEKNLVKYFGAPFFDSIQAARTHGMVLLCEDEIFRNFAKENYDVAGAWLELVLREMTSTGLINDDELNGFLIRLIESNHFYVSFSASTLLKAAALSEWRPCPPFTKIASLLRQDSTSDDSALVIGISFIKLQSMERNTPFSLDNLIYEIFKGLFNGRNPQKLKRQVFDEINRQFALLPLQKRDVIETYLTWLRASHL